MLASKTCLFFVDKAGKLPHFSGNLPFCNLPPWSVRNHLGNQPAAIFTLGKDTQHTKIKNSNKKTQLLAFEAQLLKLELDWDANENDKEIDRRGDSSTQVLNLWTIIIILVAQKQIRTKMLPTVPSRWGRVWSDVLTSL